MKTVYYWLVKLATEQFKFGNVMQVIPKLTLSFTCGRLTELWRRGEGRFTLPSTSNTNLASKRYLNQFIADDWVQVSLFENYLGVGYYSMNTFITFFIDILLQSRSYLIYERDCNKTMIVITFFCKCIEMSSFMSLSLKNTLPLF